MTVEIVVCAVDDGQDGEIGEAREPETHLIPNVDTRVGPIELFGNDCDTLDDACMRDYIHVEDLCEAHLKAPDYMQANDGYHVFNLDTGRGYLVLQALQHCREFAVADPVSVVGPRSLGGPSVLVASATRAADQLGWQPRQGLSGYFIE